ncbi:MAG: peptidase [Rhodospirillales bacterium]|nr:peptidase [Rhodospirillales bacterium]
MVKSFLAVALVVGLLSSAAARSASADGPSVTQVSVDATDVVRGVYHVREVIPAKPGALTLRLAKWLPGHHSASGRIDALAGLVVSASGKDLPWVRDPDDMWAFNVSVPSGQTSIQVRFDFITPLQPSQGRVSMTPSMLELEWDMVVLYPVGVPVKAIQVAANVKLPDGWSFATALSTRTPSRHEPIFATTDLATLIDSPLLAAPRLQTTDLGEIGTASVKIDLAQDAEEPVVMTDERLKAFREMVRQLGLAFGSQPPFAQYTVLLTVSEEFGRIGWEHLRSSEVGVAPSTFKNWNGHVEARTVLAHEFVHAWNGKYRRPEGLDSPDLAKPMSGALLWVYEGLTQYYAHVISARAGIISEAEARDAFAAKASQLASVSGRRWRPLADTTNQPSINPLHNPVAWQDWRRSLMDYYDEGALVWLDVDAKIRTLTQGRKSLDDFSARFFHADAPTLDPKFYTLENVVADLNSIVPYEWADYFQRTVYSIRPEPPTSGIEAAGWRVTYDATPSAMQTSDILDLIDSIGLAVNDKGEVRSVRWDGPASKAGLTPGAIILAVNAAPFSMATFRAGIAQRAGKPGPIALIVKARGRVLNLNVEYHGGLTYPHLSRRADGSDLLREILAAR